MRSFDGVLVDLMRGARQELQFASYYMMPQRLVFGELEAAVRRGVKTVVILNRFREQSAVTKRFLCRLQSKNLLLYSFEKPGSDLHAKVIVSDRNAAIVGSANLSFHGIYMNYEIGIEVTGKEAWEVSRLIDIIASLSKPVTCEGTSS
ncbi:MAG: phospholipase D family protein [Nitrososphaeria archaeon]